MNWDWYSFCAGLATAFCVAFVLIQLFGWDGKK